MDNFIVYVTCDNNIERLHTDLSESEALDLYLPFCYAWYNSNGIDSYMERNCIDVMAPHDFDNYYKSQDYLDHYDMVHVAYEQFNTRKPS